LDSKVLKIKQKDELWLEVLSQMDLKKPVRFDSDEESYDAEVEKILEVKDAVYEPPDPTALEEINSYLRKLPKYGQFKIPRAKWDKVCNTVENLRSMGKPIKEDIKSENLLVFRPRAGQDLVYEHFKTYNKYCCLTSVKKDVKQLSTVRGTKLNQIALYSKCKVPSCPGKFVFTVKRIPTAGDISVFVQ
jgi:hypothetical protein